MDKTLCIFSESLYDMHQQYQSRLKIISFFSV